jgi:hypothetical protein
MFGDIRKLISSIFTMLRQQVDTTGVRLCYNFMQIWKLTKLK